MRIAPNHPRLRLVAIVCWILGGWWVVQLSLLNPFVYPPLLTIAVVLASSVLLAVGIAFWQLATDKRAGVVLDAKGLMLNMGHYAAFIAWENISDVGVSQHRASLLALGSNRQLGFKLRNPHAYLQSYEVRLPAAHGPLAVALRLLDWVLRPICYTAALPTVEHLERTRTRTGYDVLIPEALLGGRAEAFVEMVQHYCFDPGYRRILGKCQA